MKNNVVLCPNLHRSSASVSYTSSFLFSKHPIPIFYTSISHFLYISFLFSMHPFSPISHFLYTHFPFLHTHFQKTIFFEHNTVNIFCNITITISTTITILLSVAVVLVVRVELLLLLFTISSIIIII